MEICAIIVNYRSARLVGDLFESIARRGEEWISRVIVVDNASGDGSVETLRAKAASLGIAGRTDVLDAGRNHGFGAGNNFGAASAFRDHRKPDVLWFLNPDTLVDGVDLGRAVEWFERDARVGIVGTGLDDGAGRRDLGGHNDPSLVGEFVRGGGTFGVLQRFAVSNSALDRPGEVDWVSGASLMMRSDLFTRLGGFDEGFFLYFEEVDLCRRARQEGWKVVYEPRVRIVHLEGQTTGVHKTKRRSRFWYESRQRYFVKHFGVAGLLKADVAWSAGRLVSAVRRRRDDTCGLGDMWRCDAPVILEGGVGMRMNSRE